MEYIVTWPRLAITLADGSEVVVVKGDVVPSGADPAYLENLVVCGMLTRRPATPPAQPSAEGTPPAVPLRSALKAEWVAYAISTGLDPVIASALKKEELVARFAAPDESTTDPSTVTDPGDPAPTGETGATRATEDDRVPGEDPDPAV